MTRLSVNINKVATIRNARGGNNPDLVKVAMDCERFGAEGITVHPRPDERHIRAADIPLLKAVVKTEFNMEGYPDERFIQLVLDNQPHQVTLVPDPPEALTSSSGWDTITHQGFLQEVTGRFREAGIRTSIFLDPDTRFVEPAKACGTDRIELYTEPYAEGYEKDKEEAIAPFKACAEACQELELGVNAGHDLNLENLNYFAKNIPNLLEVSIGHALICDALYLGLANTIHYYSRQLDLI